MEATIAPEQRQQALADRIRQNMAAGWKVETQTDYTATLVKGGPNHILHIILSILTAGLWLIVYAIVALANKKQRRVLNVDAQGNVRG